MSEIFAPKIDILPEPQKQLWNELVEIPQEFNPQLTLKALCYFDDGTVVALPTAARKRLVQAVQQVDLGNLPKI